MTLPAVHVEIQILKLIILHHNHTFQHPSLGSSKSCCTQVLHRIGDVGEAGHSELSPFLNIYISTFLILKPSEYQEMTVLMLIW